MGSTTATFGIPVLNSVSQVAFRAFLSGNSVNGANDSGIWAVDRAGLIRLIAREGDSLEVTPGNFRTIASIGFLGGTGNGEGGVSGFNDVGQLAFQASFTDGTSGIFVSNLVAIPEPATWIMLMLGLQAILFWRNRVRPDLNFLPNFLTPTSP